MKWHEARRDLVVAAIACALYWLAAQLGFVFSNHGIMTPVWPAAAIGVVTGVLYGPRSLWLAAIYVFADLVDGHYRDVAYLQRAWIEPLGLLVSAFTVNRLALRLAFDPRLENLLQIGWLLCLAATYASVNGLMVSLGYCGVLQIPSCAAAGPVSYWLQSFTGDFFGCLIVMPALMSWARWLDPQIRAAWPPDAKDGAGFRKLTTAQWRFVVSGCLCIGLGWFGIHHINLPVSAVGFLVLPLLVWAALQFRPLFVHSTILMTGLTTISLQLTASSVSFVNPKAELTSVFLFLLSVSVLTLIVNVIVQQQQLMARTLAYRAEQERIELMLQVAADAIVSFDALGRVIYFNPAAARTLLQSGVTLQGGAIATILPTPRLAQLEQNGMVALMAADPSLFSGQVFELTLSRGEADAQTLEIALAAYITNGQWNATAFIRDVTARKQQQEAIKKTSRELDTILQSTLVGIIHTVNRIHVWGNRKFAEMMGYQQQELIGQSTRLHFEDEESWRKFEQITSPKLSTGQPVVTEWQLRHRNGSSLWCELHGNPIDPGDPTKGAIWSLMDIAERKQAEAQLHQALAHQRELNELKSRFVSMTSHEFRTPLSTILSSSELLSHYSDRLPDDEKQILHSSIHTAVARMSAMMDDVLIIGQADAQRIDLKPEILDLNVFCSALVDEYRLTAPPGVVITLQADPCHQVSVDPKLLRRVLSNLLSNAIKYSPAGGPVDLQLRLAPPGLVFEVSDHGIGIPVADQARLFESFHRATNVGNISGTGLGLSIVKRSLERQGGSIEVRSQVGLGTTFRVTLPLPQEVFI